MKKIITILMLILSALSFAAKKLYVGTNAEFKPYEYLENNDILKEIKEEFNNKFKK